MQISSVSNNTTNFGVTMPVLKVLTMAKNGQEVALRGVKETHGPIYALVKRLNNDQYAKETIFMKQRLGQFRQYPFVSSTGMATANKYLIFGYDDITRVRELCEDHYYRSNLSKEDVMDIIVERFIKPIQKKYRFARFKGDKVGEPIGITLHANKVKNPNSKSGSKIYNFGIDITDKTGEHVYAVLPSVLPEVAAKQPVVNMFRTPV